MTPADPSEQTKLSAPVAGRGHKSLYGDFCPVAAALNLVGPRWSLRIIHELMDGPKSFSGIRRRLRVLSANVLARRLEELKATGIVIRKEDSAGRLYELTRWGMELEPFIIALSKWARAAPPTEKW